jgi:hypothetical protein
VRAVARAVPSHATAFTYIALNVDRKLIGRPLGAGGGGGGEARQRHDLWPRGGGVDARRARRLSRAIRAGAIWINSHDCSSLATRFGGFKQSGFGRDRSPHTIDKTTDLRTISANYQ